MAHLLSVTDSVFGHTRFRISRYVAEPREMVAGRITADM
jgi:hypothetical protein